MSALGERIPRPELHSTDPPCLAPRFSLVPCSCPAYTRIVLRSALYDVSPSRPRRADGPAAFFRVFTGRLRGSIDPAAVDSIALAIQNREGYYAGSRSFRNNNPGNLRYVGQAGATSDADGFAVFSSYGAGLQALKSQIMLDASRGSDAAGRPVITLGDLISSWAPASENDTAGYITAVSDATGFDPAAPLSSLGSGAAYFPAIVESGAGFDFSGLSSGLQKTVDLSAVGLPSAVPIYWIIGAGLVGAAFLR